MYFSIHLCIDIFLCIYNALIIPNKMNNLDYIQILRLLQGTFIQTVFFISGSKQGPYIVFGDCYLRKSVWIYSYLPIFKIQAINLKKLDVFL